MTSTPFNIGLSDNTRSSSRVLRPPGGGHTDIFGGEAEPTRGRRQGPPQPASQIGHVDIPRTTTNGSAHAQSAPQNGNHAPASDSIKEAPELTPDSPREVNDNAVPDTKPEPVKAEPVKAEPAKAEPARAEPPKRVRVPPGGFSSGLW